MSFIIFFQLSKKNKFLTAILLVAVVVIVIFSFFIPKLTFSTTYRVVDNCPFISNPAQDDGDGDGVGDVCDTCPFLSNEPTQGLCNNTSIACIQNSDCPLSHYCVFYQSDADEDGVGDECDNCPNVPNPANNAPKDCNYDGDVSDPGEATGQQCDIDNDGVGDVCEIYEGNIGCGNGIVENEDTVGYGNEVCDDGDNTNQGDCNADCTAFTFCGDGIWQTSLTSRPDEECDFNGPTDGSAGFSTDPVVAHVDGDLDPLNDIYYRCNSQCKRTGGQCGDGVLDLPYEGCDGSQGIASAVNLEKQNDSSLTNQYECNSVNCEDKGGYCGNGHLEAVEQCDRSVLNGTDGYGSGINANNTYGCDVCVFADGFCGDKILQANEGCDPTVKLGNKGYGTGIGPFDHYECEANNHSCFDSGTCLINYCYDVGGYCGDGYKDPVEQCDLGLNNGINNPDPNAGESIENPHKCSVNQGVNRGCYADINQGGGGWCGDGIKQVEYGEECDLGVDNGISNPNPSPDSKDNPYLCSTTCQAQIENGGGGWCGDGIIQDAYELCESGITNEVERCQLFANAGLLDLDDTPLNCDGTDIRDMYNISILYENLCLNCQFDCLADDKFSKIGSGCYLDDNGNGQIDVDECNKGIYRCESNNIICYQDPNWAGIAKDYCCLGDDVGLAATTVDVVDITLRGDGSATNPYVYRTCDEICRDWGAQTNVDNLICVGVGLNNGAGNHVECSGPIHDDGGSNCSYAGNTASINCRSLIFFDGAGWLVHGYAYTLDYQEYKYDTYEECEANSIEAEYHDVGYAPEFGAYSGYIPGIGMTNDNRLTNRLKAPKTWDATDESSELDQLYTKRPCIFLPAGTVIQGDDTYTVASDGWFRAYYNQTIGSNFCYIGSGQYRKYHNIHTTSCYCQQMPLN